jgi:hypothetical protein
MGKTTIPVFLLLKYTLSVRKSNCFELRQKKYNFQKKNCIRKLWVNYIQGVRFFPSFSKLDRFEIPPFCLVESEKDVGFFQNEWFSLAFSSLSNLEKEGKNLTPCTVRWLESKNWSTPKVNLKFIV